MPLLRGSATFSRFRLASGQPPRDARRWLARGLARGAFEPLDLERGDEDRATGFVTLADPDSTDFEGGVLERGRALFAWRVDTVRIRSAAVRAQLGRWAAAFEKEHGRLPARGEKATARDQIRHELRRRAEPSSRISDVSWNLDAGELQIWAASRKAVEEIAAGIEAAFEVKLEPRSVSAAAVHADIPESALAPTAELLGLGEEEVSRGQA
jgi:recombination associated protein RdgC